MDLSSLARTLAERLMCDAHCAHHEVYTEPVDCYLCVSSVIREAIEKTLEEAEKAICPGCANDIPIANGGGIRMHVDPHSGGIMVCHSAAIHSLKQSNSVAEDEGPCAACGQPKSDSAMHLDSPGKGWGAALHWFKQSNSGMEVKTNVQP